MKSASSELDALSGGVAGNCLLPPENEYAVPNIVARVAMASCRRGNVSRDVPMGGIAGAIGTVIMGVLSRHKLPKSQELEPLGRD